MNGAKFSVFLEIEKKTSKFAFFVLMEEISYLLLGGNIGDRMEYLHRAVDLLRRDAGNVTALSAVYESEPWGFEDPVWFLNQVAVVETNLSPVDLLAVIRQIEQHLGRPPVRDGYQARTMDIDILLYGKHIINLPELTIPHPRMAERMFALAPMAELAPDLEHPVLQCTMQCLRDTCSTLTIECSTLTFPRGEGTERGKGGG